MTAMRTLPLLVLLLAAQACASAPPLEVASVTLDAGRSALSLRCQYETPACEKARLALNVVISGYNLALQRQALGEPAGEQAVADAAVAVLQAIQGLLPTVDGGAP